MSKEPISIKNKHILTGHSGAIYSIASDGDFIYSASADKFVVRWNARSGEQDKFAIKFHFTPYSICLFNENSLVAVGLASGDLYIFNIKERKEIKFYTQHKKGIFSVSENVQANQLYVGDADGNISIWDTRTLELIIYLPFDCGKIRKIIPSLDGKQFFFAAQDGDIRIIDSTTFNESSRFFGHKDGATSLLHLSKQTLISGGKDAHLKIWDLSTNKLQKSIPAHNFVLYDLLKLNDSMIVSASRDKSIKVWDVESMNVISRLERKQGGHQHSVNQLIRLSDTEFASCSDDATIRVWTL